MTSPTRSTTGISHVVARTIVARHPPIEAHTRQQDQADRPHQHHPADQDVQVRAFAAVRSRVAYPATASANPKAASRSELRIPVWKMRFGHTAISAALSNQPPRLPSDAEQIGGTGRDLSMRDVAEFGQRNSEWPTRL